jgi:hypothetical protein
VSDQKQAVVRSTKSNWHDNSTVADGEGDHETVDHSMGTSSG